MALHHSGFPQFACDDPILMQCRPRPRATTYLRHGPVLVCRENLAAVTVGCCGPGAWPGAKHVCCPQPVRVRLDGEVRGFIHLADADAEPVLVVLTAGRLMRAKPWKGSS